MSIDQLHRGKVAVLGLGMCLTLTCSNLMSRGRQGISGVTAVKNLIEQGFEVTGFERNDYIGGLWQKNLDPSQTTALKVTTTNVSKQFSAYQDFPFPDDAPDYCTADKTCEYIRSYAAHFSLAKHFSFGVTIDRIERDSTTSTSATARWLIKGHGREGHKLEEVFDRVLVTTGPFSQPFTPRIPGLLDFGGEVLHSMAYKGPEPFAGKRVVVVGLGNTGGDIAVELCGIAKQVFLSHRAGTRIMPRYNKRRPRDHGLTRRRIAFAGQFNSLFPRLATVLTSYILDKTFLSANPGYKQEWKLIPAPPFTNVPGVINDDLMNRLMDGQVTNVSGVTRFTAAGIVTSDQDVVPVDVVIFATGSHFDYSILSDEANPTVFSSTEWDASEHNNDMKFPRLYKTLLSTRFPDTLAFIGPCRGFSLAAFTNSDLASQAIAQIWKGLYPIPNPSELEAWCDQNYMRALKQVRTWRISKTGSDPVEFERWLNEAAGNGVNEALGWGWQGWKFWWSERELYRLIVDGINTPFVYRLFSGRHGARTQWEGAREAIYKANGLTPK